MSRFGFGILLVCLLATSAAAQTFIDVEGRVAVDPRRGADDRVDYESLTQYGPWDDRNYMVTLEDLDLLADNELELRAPIPVFFRVMMRRGWSDLPRTGPAQYPRSAYQIFRQKFGGCLVGGKFYRKVKYEDNGYKLILDEGIGEEEFYTEFLSGESRVTSPNGAAESAIKINPVNTDQVIAGSNGPGGGQAMHYSTDGGETWTQVALPLGSTCCDPAVDWSSDGNFAYAVTLGSCSFFGGCGVWFYRSDDGGQTWTDLQDITPGDPRREVATGGGDKEFMHVDQYSGSPHQDNIYITWHNGNVMQIARSTDFGNTWTTQSFGSAPRGIGSDVTTDKNGTVYHIYASTSAGTIQLLRSTNGGVTYESPIQVADTQGVFDYPIPAMDSRLVFIYASADSDLSDGPFGGSVYAAWSDTVGPETGSAATNHSRITVGYSRDGGDTWNTSTPHETADALEVDRFHQWLSVGPDGTVHVIYYDTRRDATRRAVDIYYSFSTDGAVTWSTPERVTSVQSPHINDGFEWGDYNGMDIVMDDLIAIFTDNRSEGGGSGDSVDVYAAGITPGGGAFCGNGNTDAGEVCDGTDLGGQTCTDFGCGGGTLACASDCNGVDTSGCLACGGPGRVPGGSGVPGTPLLVNRSGGDVVLSWDTSCGGGDDFAVYEGIVGSFNSQVPVQCSTAGLTSLTFTPGAGNRFFLVVPTASGNEGSYGLDSDGAERAVSASACAPQSVGTCP
ncbi:hypothetical protein ABI59_18195 [Acidobacteria bacterium Mor1]|nr:hypothetical protein ABI59_18195 [Acidobacteria bacterium Mor1]